MRLYILLIVVGAVVLFTWQVFLFGNYNRELTSLAAQVSRTEELQSHLKRALEGNANLSRLYSQLDERLGRAYITIAEERSKRLASKAAAAKTKLRGSGSLLTSSESVPESRKQSAKSGIEQRIYPSGNEDEECVGPPHDTAGVIAAVVTVVFDREDYLKRHAQSLLDVHGADPSNRKKFPLFFSQDGTPPHEATRLQAQSYKQISYLHHKELVAPKVRLPHEKIAYYRIAAHYKFILKTIFDCFQYPRLIFLEDDMDLAPDFFSYFEALTPLLDKDPTLMCISSWNDHGQTDTLYAVPKQQYVKDTKQLYRSDFFPGLGWMLRNDFWHDIKEGWPDSYWDDHIRKNTTRKGRQCIRPEVCRTYNFGREGSSKGMFFGQFLEPIRLNADNIDWKQEDLSHLELPRYDEDMEALLAAAPLAKSAEEAQAVDGNVRLQYDSQPHYEQMAAPFGMLLEWRDGVPRGAYRGVVSIRAGKTRVFFQPSEKFVKPVVDPDKYVYVDSTGAIIRNGQARL